jgi:hypothetical protein
MVLMMGTSRRRTALEAASITAVVATAALTLVLTRAELTQVPYLNDSAMHEEMVRFALTKLKAGHFPPDSWFPFLNLGSPQYLHYQSLAAMLTALLGWAIGVGRAFSLSVWLLVGCWPLCVYAAGRLIGVSRGAAIAAATLSPFVSSWTGIGYEQISYLWSGYGVWSQLWAMWTLPIAWALSWRAVSDGRYVFFATVTIAATSAMHFETGYLAFGGVLVCLALRPHEIRVRAPRALVLLLGAAAAVAWVIVPLVAQGKWASINQFLQTGQSGVDVNSYGAPVVMHQLVTGGVFDFHHLELITPLVGIGLFAVVSLWRRRRSDLARNDGERLVALLFVCCLVLFFGRATFGPLFDLLPGAKNLFLRRFIVGVQLGGLFLAGIGAAEIATLLRASMVRIVRGIGMASTRLAEAVACGLIAAAVAAALVPAWAFVVTSSDADASLIARQAVATTAAKDVSVFIARVQRDGGGRVFAGDPSDWGSRFRVGEVPVFKFLASQDVDEVGFTLRTASLMSDPEVNFDEYNAADYVVFGIRWLVLPSSMAPPVPAQHVMTRGRFALWQLPATNYVQVIDTRGSVASTTSDLASFSATFLAELGARPIFPTVAFEGQPGASGTLVGSGRPSQAPGAVISQSVDLVDGTASAQVVLRRRAVVLLSVSFDPGWHALVDGRPVASEMIAPALVGVPVDAGPHSVRFVYRGFPDYPQLIALGLVALLATALLERRWRRVRRTTRFLPRRPHHAARDASLR